MRKWIILGMVGVIVAGGVFAALTLGVLAAPTYHNRCIGEAMQDATSIHVRCKALLPHEYVPREVTITDKTEIQWLLQRLRLPPLVTSGGMHACKGHLAITIHTPTDSYELSYDHGDGMYPITEPKKSHGFIDMKPNVCTELNDYFRSLGYTNDEIGVHED